LLPRYPSVRERKREGGRKGGRETEREREREREKGERERDLEGGGSPLRSFSGEEM